MVLVLVMVMVMVRGRRGRMMEEGFGNGARVIGV